MLGDLLPEAGHGPGDVEEDDDVLGVEVRAVVGGNAASVVHPSHYPRSFMAPTTGPTLVVGYLGAGGGLDVPVAHPGVVHVRVVLVHQPLHRGVLGDNQMRTSLETGVKLLKEHLSSFWLNVS